MYPTALKAPHSRAGDLLEGKAVVSTDDADLQLHLEWQDGLEGKTP